MDKERYKEEYEEGLGLLCPSDKEEKITRQFYKDLSNLSKNQNSNNKQRKNFLEYVLQIITGKDVSK